MTITEIRIQIKLGLLTTFDKRLFEVEKSGNTFNFKYFLLVNLN
jgi:hypothetical protein